MGVIKVCQVSIIKYWGTVALCIKQHISNTLQLSALLLLLVSTQSLATSVPEDRSDVLYHSYDGGGVTITGPSVLVRKDYKDKVSVYANYYVDMVTSASIDVLTQGSPYTEERTEMSAGIDYLNDRTTLSVGTTQSDESDYKAKTGHVGISQAFFSDLTTLSLGYSHGEDEVGRNYLNNGVKETEWVGDAKRRRFNMGITQILTKNWIVALNAESVIDDGFLNNPYRRPRYLTGGTDSFGRPVAADIAHENYPLTRNSDALAIRTLYYLPYRASVRLEGRAFTDSWGIDASHYEFRYIHPYQDKYIFEFKARTYSQGKADFYQDIFDDRDPLADTDEAEFRARDKELSNFASINIGIGVTYDLQKTWHFINKQTVSFFFDTMRFNYEDFRDARLSDARFSNGEAPLYAPGQEPSYTLNAHVLRIFYSAYY